MLAGGRQTPGLTSDLSLNTGDISEQEREGQTEATGLEHGGDVASSQLCFGYVHINHQLFFSYQFSSQEKLNDSDYNSRSCECI